MDFNNVEEFLRNGGKAEDIAKAFADQLNTAIATINDEEELEEATTNACEAWDDFVDTYFCHNDLPDNFTVEDFYMSEEEAVKILDFLVQIAPTFVKYVSAIEKLSDNAKYFSNTLQSNLRSSADFQEVINKFFNKMNI